MATAEVVDPREVAPLLNEDEDEYASTTGAIEVEGGTIGSNNPLDEALELIGFGKYQMILLVLCSIGMMVIMSEMLMFAFLEASDFATQFNVTTLQFAIWASGMSLFTMLGGIGFGYWADYSGRRIPFMAAIAICGIFGVASAFSNNYIQMLMLQLTVTTGAGGLLALDTMMFMEQTPASSRGQDTLYIAIFANLGIIYNAVLGMAFLSGNGLILGWMNWRWYVALVAAPIIISAIMRVVVSEESPRYLVMANEPEAAHGVLVRIAQMNGQDPDLTVPPVEIFRTYCTNLQKNGSGEVQGWEALKAVLAQPVTPYITGSFVIFNMVFWSFIAFVNILLIRANVAAVFADVYASLASIPAFFIMWGMIDRPQFGRVLTLKLFYIGLALSFLILVIWPTPMVSFGVWIAFMFFSTPINALLLIYSPELYPTEIRATTMGFLTFAANFAEIFGQLATGYAVANLSMSMFGLLFLLMTLAGLMFTWPIKQETAGTVMH